MKEIRMSKKMQIMCIQSLNKHITFCCVYANIYISFMQTLIYILLMQIYTRTYVFLDVM